jgi:hypothetical protein
LTIGACKIKKVIKFKLVDYYSIISKMRTSFDWHKLLRGENRFNVGKMCHAARQPTTNYG